MKNKLNLLSFLLPLFEMEVSGGGGDVGSAPDPAVIAAVDSSSAPTESPSADSNADDVTVGGQQATEVQGEVDPLKDVPTLAELQEQVAQKVPHAQALANLRAAYEGVKPQLDEYKAFEPWKEVVQAIGDPQQAQLAHELVGLLHSKVVTNGVEEITSRPFLERLESESPGTVDQIFADLLTYQVPGENGQMDTLVRQLYRSHGLNPDRLDDYRNIDTLRASGVVTDADLSGIPDKFHAAFKALSATQREDILAQKSTDGNFPAVTLDYLQDKAEALEARSWREKDEDTKRQSAEQSQAQFKQQVAAATEQDIATEVHSIHDSILQNLSSQFTFSSDAAVNSLEHSKIMATLATLQNPAYRFVAEEALKAVGVTLNGFDELTNRWEDRRSAYTQYKAYGDNLQANRALSEATAAKQQILAKLNDYALKLAKASGERAATAADAVNGQLETATARFVPAGSGAVQGNNNPYANNPHPVGSQEYYAYNRNLDKQYKLTNASVFS
jgi:hypothetical protein